jgi:hypothetical protein
MSVATAEHFVALPEDDIFQLQLQSYSWLFMKTTYVSCMEAATSIASYVWKKTH